MKKLLTKSIICATFASLCFATEEVDLGKLEEGSCSPLSIQSVQNELKLDEVLIQLRPLPIINNLLAPTQARDTERVASWTEKFIKLVASNSREIAVGVATLFIIGEIHHLLYS